MMRNLGIGLDWQRSPAKFERHLQDKGLLDAHCEGDFQFSIGGPDSKTIVLKLGRKTYGAHIKDAFDVNQSEAIAEMFLERVRAR